MSGYLLLLALFALFIWLLLPERPGPEAGLPHRAPADGGEKPLTEADRCAVEELVAAGFEGPHRFLLDEDPREAIHLVNRNLAIHYTRHLGTDEERFLTFFADGGLLATGTIPLALKSLEGSGLVFGDAHREPTAGLLVRHAAALREAVALGRLPRHASREGFFTDLGDCVELADAERVRRLHAQMDEGRFARDAADPGEVATLLLRRDRDGLTLMATSTEVSVDRSDPVPAELARQVAAGGVFPLSAYRGASAATAIPLSRIVALGIDRFGDGAEDWAFAVFADDGRMILLAAPEVVPVTGRKDEPAEVHLMHLAWFVREQNPLAQIFQFKRENGRPVASA